MSQPSTSYTSEMLYEEAYNIQYNWDKILPLDVLEFHTMHQLIYKWELFCLLWLAAWVPKHVVISLPLHLV